MTATEIFASVNAFYILATLVAIGFLLILISTKSSNKKASRH